MSDGHDIEREDELARELMDLVGVDDDEVVILSKDYELQEAVTEFVQDEFDFEAFRDERAND